MGTEWFGSQSTPVSRSDEANNGPFRDGKRSMYEGGLRIPTLVVWKGKVTPESTTEHRAISMDFYPTLAAVAEVEVASKHLF
jgi:arylsulfatase A-like enzyme